MNVAFYIYLTFDTGGPSASRKNYVDTKFDISFT